MKRLIVHLGSYKTGTSSIQNLCFEHRDLLRQHGVLYPETGVRHEPHIGYRHSDLVFPYTRGHAPAFPDALKQECLTANCDTLLLSSEAWSNPKYFAHLSALLDAAVDLGVTEVDAVLYLRDVEAYKVSHYREFTINQGNVLPYQQYVDAQPGLFDYRFVVRALRGILGERLRVFRFDKSVDVRAHFFQQLDLGAFWQAAPPTAHANVKSAGALAVEVVRLARQLQLPFERVAQALTALMQAHPEWAQAPWTELPSGSSPPVLSPALLAEFATWVGWPLEEAARLFAPSPRDAVDVAMLRPLIEERLRTA